ncbi:MULTISPECIES: flagellar biosynthetic protein FliO [unclassified Marinimicrobium]|jgi:flagellar protein FliO/FliZ|uniref:flagellar biosynthetic protein FliO n=1 Tax=unclassified Marinimicrobium TaxID=2632100 RepID=UPI00257C1D5F|nr:MULTISPECIES: flagellar biosynthetic protein FliO [unclassified Marinimicrobium]|tara:strand:- start:104 stop:442 length:339 start_codon:yes stop_codon:yes gene_type:complete
MEGSAATQLISVLFSLLLIIALIFALAWLLRRFGQGAFTNSSAMKVVATLPLGTRERLLVVEVGGQQLLLGVTAQQIRTLHVFEEPVIDAQGVRSSDFKQRLMNIMNKNTKP